MREYILNAALLLLCLSLNNLIYGQKQNRAQEERIYIKLEIKGLACPFCAGGMAKDLEEIAGVDKVDLSFEEGIAYLSTPVAQKPTKEELFQIVLKAGFTPGEITFSEKPFERPSKKKKRNRSGN